MDTVPGHKERVTPTESPQRLIAYQIDEDDCAPIRPAPRERRWMDNAYQKFPYRCLPLVVANQYGWEILSTHHIRATWDGTSKPKGLYVENMYGDGCLHGHSHFGEGVLTFQIPFLFKTRCLELNGPWSHKQSEGRNRGSRWHYRNGLGSLNVHDELALHESMHGGVRGWRTHLPIFSSSKRRA
jgi:hypothetical protein